MQSRHPHIRDHCKHGQSLAEYILILTMVALVSVAALTMLGAGVQQAVAYMSGSMSNSNSSGKGSAGKTQDTSDSSLIASKTANVNQNPTTEANRTITTNKGNVIDLSSPITNFKESVVTSGSNGTTMVLANNITTLAEKLMKAGEINRDQYAKLTELANSGHEIADAQKILEDALKKAKTGNQFAQMTTTINGQTYTMQELSKLIGYQTGVNDPAAVSDPLNDSRVKGFIQDFLTTYQSALQSGALNDPAIRQEVDRLSSQITLLSESFACAVNPIADDNKSPATMAKSLASKVSHLDSVGICSTGKGKDSGTNCSG